MADRDAQQELKKRARRRLVGATVLALAAAIILPMVMDQEPQPPGQDIQVRIPDRNAAPEAPLALRAPAPAGSETGGSPRAGTEAAGRPAEAAPAEAQAQKLPATTSPEEVAKPGSEPKPAAAPAEATKSTAEAAEAKSEPASDREEAERVKAILSGSSEFVVQLGVFSEAANARKIQARAKAQGYNSFTETIDTPKGKKTRVRAGPFATREAAEQALEKLRKSGLNGIVAPRA